MKKSSGILNFGNSQAVFSLPKEISPDSCDTVRDQ
jgi:hypothetical protein